MPKNLLQQTLMVQPLIPMHHPRPLINRHTMHIERSGTAPSSPAAVFAHGCRTTPSTSAILTFARDNITTRDAGVACCGTEVGVGCLGAEGGTAGC
ncbi:hypothetical protein BAUCODRAFT_124555 [Baudoinia panamericana UAMH 10762]|uniref:Uncharacterized protein n=1 Tax=Baudoinia panamericana (strain UAMH 10762) TaxID=717646 RepID=M2N453_BAUPA|nr:uncharacterized protein BAUCODRAFT_124555 [Baudoinia panamericana UAMH 10762]EMC93799.1 hypothetical protein BAUCODRAFT_124555 [Baudoinia panamericana UAMH 10762]